MGREYDADLAIGYVIDPAGLPAKFTRQKPEVFHFEDRFDPKTGAKLPDKAKVIDQEERDVFVFDGKEYDDVFDFLEAVAEEIGAEHGYGGDFNFDAHVVQWIGPPIPRSESEGQEAGVCLAWLVQEHSRIIAIGERLGQLGFKVGAPRVYPILNVS
jgi:hypothetical protein